MAKKQHYGIKYPFISDGYEKFFVDTNDSVMEKVKSQLIHVIFTPKGQRLRNPQFGTDLIKHIFEQDDSASWESIKSEVSEAVQRWIPDCSLNDIEVVSSETDEHEIYVKLTYSVQQGNKVTTDSVVVEL